MNSNEMENVVKFLKEEREQRKITQGQLSYKSGISTSILSKIEQGTRNPSYQTVLAISDALGINRFEILEKLNLITPQDLDKELVPLLKNKLDEELENISTIDNMTIPIYNSASAGVGRIAESIPDDYLSLPMKCIENTVGIKIDGDSMYPTITDGAIVILKKDTEVSDGEIGVFLLNDEAYVKRIIRKDDFIFLYSDNMIYQPIIVTQKDNFIICGKVIKTINIL